MADVYPIGEVKIKPHDQSRLLLGSFTKDTSPTGFSVHVTPESEYESITSTVISLDKKANAYNLIMNIENFGDKTVKAQVWPM